MHSIKADAKIRTNGYVFLETFYAADYNQYFDTDILIDNNFDKDFMKIYENEIPKSRWIYLHNEDKIKMYKQKVKEREIAWRRKQARKFPRFNLNFNLFYKKIPSQHVYKPPIPIAPMEKIGLLKLL